VRVEAYQHAGRRFQIFQDNTQFTCAPKPGAAEPVCGVWPRTWVEPDAPEYSYTFHQSEFAPHSLLSDEGYRGMLVQLVPAAQAAGVLGRVCVEDDRPNLPKANGCYGMDRCCEAKEGGGCLQCVDPKQACK
jgi:hypothetical protein